jgi:DNA-binding Lrp family transcriptional regulator
MGGAILGLLDRFQRDFPLCPRPYAVIGEALGWNETGVIDALAALKARGCVSRVGATIVPGRLGAATLAAMSVPPERLDAVAALVNGYREVNHNYEREHALNLWFVITAPDEGRVREVVREVERRANCGKVLAFPMVEAYHLDLGFRLAGDAEEENSRPRASPDPVLPAPCTLDAAQRRVLLALQEGLPLTARPYAEIGRASGMSEDAVIAAIAQLVDARVIARLGVIVRHRKLGYRANAMAVWDVPDAQVRARGQALAREGGVSLCYRRLRHLPHWRYNLYCMIHGRDRDAVRAKLERLARRCGLERYPSAVLFSRRCFKQCGARYLEEDADGRNRSPDRERAAERISDR